MPGRKTHTTVGTLAGVGAALVHARDETGAAKWVEVIGGGAGGYLGGRMPDLLEPGVSRYHRQMAHSVMALLAALGISSEVARNHCRAQADACALRSRNAALGPAEQLFAALAELFWRFIAGALGGLQAGYASHLLLDARTPMGLPLLFR